MITVVLVIHLLVAIALVGTVLLQRSEGGGLGMGGGGGGGGGGGFMSGRETANLLTRATGVLAAIFMSTSLILGIMASGPSKTGSIMDQPVKVQQPAEPEQPKAPIAD